MPIASNDPPRSDDDPRRTNVVGAGSASAAQLGGALRESRVAERVQGVPGSGIRRFFDIISTMEHVISLGVGEPDFVTPWPISEAGIRAIEQGHTHYTSNLGLLELREAIARDLARRYGVEWDPYEEMLITTGVSEGLDLAARAVIDPGDEVIVADPSYAAHAPAIMLAGGVPVPIATRAAQGFALDPRSVEAAVTRRTKALMIAYPSNPTGAVLERSTLEALADIARRHNLLVISDEIYDRLVYGGYEHTPIRVAARDERPHDHPRRILEVARDDWLASRMGRSTVRPVRRDAQDSPIRHDVRADGGAVRRPRSGTRWRGIRGLHARGV